MAGGEGVIASNLLLGLRPMKNPVARCEDGKMDGLTMAALLRCRQRVFPWIFKEGL
jgi:hypothetical protein